MNHSKRMEIVGVLSLSLLITSAFAVSSCLPEMMKTFSEYDRSALELLMSAPSFTMLLMIALTPVISKFLSERFMVITGLTTFGISGLVPVFVKSYTVIFIARIFMGLGIGLLNAKAVSMIGERFSGELRSKLQGLRCSMETLGQSALMLLVGLLLPYGWNYAFLVYASAFIILLMYLAFVPASNPLRSDMADPAADNTVSYKLTTKDWFVVIRNFLLGLTLVSGQMIISLRITSYLVEYGIGTSVDGANLLSISVFFGFIGGVLFGKLLQVFKNKVLPLALVVAGISLAAIGMFQNLTIITIASCMVNMCLTIGLSYMFNGLSDQVPVGALNTANSMVLVGCNLGSSITPFIFGIIGMFSPKLTVSYLTYAVVFTVLGLIIFVNHKKSSNI
ncbi:MAG: MFS transporter [Lachnospiraceae bacterium]|nr:MFS transporter [Lachnospiraceae bacterium]